MKQNVNYIKHCTSVYSKMSDDDRLSSIHLSVYNALFLIWNNSFFDSELSINRNEVMRLSKIGNANTYTKSLKNLHEFGYITYKPSHNPLIGSKVTIIRFDTSSDITTDTSGGISSASTSDKSSDTLYKLLNNKTLKLINTHYELINDRLDFWINSAISKSESNKNVNENKFSFKKSLLEFGGDEKLINDWISVRKTKKATNTETALNKFISQVNSSDLNINQALQICVENSWSGFNADWIKNLKSNPFDLESHKPKRPTLSKLSANAALSIPEQMESLIAKGWTREEVELVYEGKHDGN